MNVLWYKKSIRIIDDKINVVDNIEICYIVIIFIYPQIIDWHIHVMDGIKGR